MNRFYLIWLILFVGSSAAQGQVATPDTVLQASAEAPIAASDTVASQMPVKREKHPFVTPKKTALFSAILPGLGQVYNGDYWKLPVIYGGLGVAAYYINLNLREYNNYRSEYIRRINNAPQAEWEYKDYDVNTVEAAMRYYKRYLDLTVMITALGYTAQILDALVFAHLKNFDISTDLSLKMRPAVMPEGAVGVRLVLNF